MILYDIAHNGLSSPYELGKNDCNIMCLRIVDLRAGTAWADTCQYASIKEGIKQLHDLGFSSTGDIIREYADEVTHPIDGDIWIENDNPLIMGVIFSNRMIGVNTEHNKFQLNPIRNDGVFYRVRKQHNGWNSE